jgi:hypothetical protein
MDHPRHDLELIARVAAGDGSEAEARSAALLRNACADCRLLDADLRAIAAGTTELRGAAASMAPRDFRLSPADAARLRRRGVWLLGRPGAAINRGMGRFGGGLVAIGLVGLVFGSGLVGGLGAPGLGGGQPAALPAPSAGPTAGTSTGKDSSEGMVLAPAQTAPVVAPPPSPSVAQGRTASGSGAGQSTTGARDDSGYGTPANPVLYVSLAALVVGLGLLVAARNGRRAGP